MNSIEIVCSDIDLDNGSTYIVLSGVFCVGGPFKEAELREWIDALPFERKLMDLPTLTHVLRAQRAPIN